MSIRTEVVDYITEISPTTALPNTFYDDILYFKNLIVKRSVCVFMNLKIEFDWGPCHCIWEHPRQLILYKMKNTERRCFQ